MLGDLNHNNRLVFFGTCCGALLLCVGFFLFFLRPLSGASASTSVFEIRQGEGFQDIIDRLANEHLIRSAPITKLYVLFTGRAHQLKSGAYLLRPAMSTEEVISTIQSSAQSEVTVTIREGLSRFDIDLLLSQSNILPRGVFLAHTSSTLEGMFFPDTYRFFVNSIPDVVVSTLRNNFEAKTKSIFSGGTARRDHVLRVASLLENEVSGHEDRRLVAGIIEKRLAAHMPLQIDATICYIKKSRSLDLQSCYPLTPLDFKIDSPYNSYIHVGLPPYPIGNPGLDALETAQFPEKSDYWFYLSDPATKRTIFSKTLDSQIKNRIKYLKG